MFQTLIKRSKSKDKYFIIQTWYATGELLKVDPWLALNMYFGPVIPAQYRVMGPGAWSDAREVILTTWKRFEHPLQTRKVPPSLKINQNIFMFVPLAVLLLVILYLLQI